MCGIHTVRQESTTEGCGVEGGREGALKEGGLKAEREP